MADVRRRGLLRLWVLCALWAAAAAGCATRHPRAAAVGGDENGPAVHQAFVSTAAGKKVEYYWAKPDGDGPFPALIYIHGHQPGARPGAQEMVSFGVVERVAR